MANQQNLKPFEAGQSGNSAGRPKGSKNRATIVKKWLLVKSKETNWVSGKTESLTQEDLITLSLIKSAHAGDVPAYKALMDSAYGAPKQEIENSGRLDLTVKEHKRVIEDYSGSFKPEQPGNDI